MCPTARREVQRAARDLAAAVAARAAARQDLVRGGTAEARRRAQVATRAERVRRACLGGTIAPESPSWAVLAGHIRRLINAEVTAVDLPMEVLADPGYDPADLTGGATGPAVRIDVKLDADTVVLRGIDGYRLIYMPPADLTPLAAATYEQLRHDGTSIDVACDAARLLA